LPLLFKFGLSGLAAAVAVQTAANVICRAYYLRRLFNGFHYLAHAMRAILPTVPAVAVVLLIRVVETGQRTLAMAIGELVIYVLLTIAATWVGERQLLTEAVGYVRGRRPEAASV
jgi:hypothetical protein